MSYKIYRFGGSILVPDLNGTQDIGTAKAKINAIDAPKGGAFDAAGKEQAFRGGYQVRTSGVLTGTTAADLNAKYNNLRSKLGVRDKLWRKDIEGNLHWVWARLEEVSVSVSAGDMFWLKVNLTFFVFSPLWNGALHGTWRLDDGYGLDSGQVLDTDLIYPLSVETTELTIVNGGNAALRNFEFAITPKTSAITGLIIRKPGETDIEWTGNIDVNTQLVIDFGMMSIKNNGVDAYNTLTLTTNHKVDDWMRLDPGNNVISVLRTGGGATSEIALVYYDGWV